MGLLDTLEGDGFEGDEMALNKVMMACEKGGQGKQCLEVLQRMKHRGLPLTNFAASLAIKALGRDGRWKEAQNVFIDLRNGGGGGREGADVRPTSTPTPTPNPTHDPDPDLDSDALPPPPPLVCQVMSYNVFVHACRGEGAWEAALQAMQWMREDGVAADRVTYNSAIRVCRQAGKWDKVRQAGSRKASR